MTAYTRSELEQIFQQAAEDEDDRYLLVIRKREGYELTPVEMLSTTYSQARVVDALAHLKETNRYGIGGELVAIFDLSRSFDEQADLSLDESISQCLGSKTRRRLRHYHHNTAHMERRIMDQGGWGLRLLIQKV